jgi:predicted O-linked N-acetylglucosamine transferase (SPINDLY family)
MCSRMAASILKGALPKNSEGTQAAKDLIATDETDYEESAIALTRGLTYTMREEGYAEGSGRLAEIRRLLYNSKWNCALFDTRRWVADLEDAYEEAWRRWVEGEEGDIYL